MKPVLRIVPDVPQTPRITMEQRINEGWDNVMCCGKTYELSDMVEQASDRLWEAQLPREEEYD